MASHARPAVLISHTPWGELLINKPCSRRSLRAHATEVDPSSAWWFGLTDEELATVYPWEDWILAMSTMSIDTEHVMEDDLFAGVRADSSVPAG